MTDENYKKLQNLSLQKKREFIHKFCLYEKIRVNAKKHNDDKNPDISALEIFLTSLSEEDRLIFTENFIMQNKDSDWYLAHWSKNHYYKKLNLIVNLFLRFLNAYSS
ncbi:MG284/MPN403 family protein [Metamycoplasma spumans]|uniref:MG284/MPN403 family protein n=1 Tax=Metamycoplasma spumans TaxID=92406 RepID=UPI0004817D60